MIVKKHNRQMRVLLAGLLCGMSFQVQALTDGNFTSCTIGGPQYDTYDFTAGEEFEVTVSGRCTASRAFSRGFHETLEITYLSGGDYARLSGIDSFTNTVIPQLPLGNSISNCLGNFCRPITVGMFIPYQFSIRGTAPKTPGKRRALIKLGVTAIGSPLYAEWIREFNLTYDVKAASCSLSSPNAVNLNFGTISSVDLDNASQSTTVLLNCPSTLRADVTLTPSRTIIGPDYGTSETSLAGLNMRAFWADTGNPVRLNSTRPMQLSAGSNSLGLSFRPQLEKGKSPSGAFLSQYTLTISYL